MAKITTGMPFVPGQVQTFELACNDMWAQMRGLSVKQLEDLRVASPGYGALIDAMIDVRTMMDGGVPTHRLRSPEVVFA
jgi:hypothetical protein